MKRVSILFIGQIISGSRSLQRVNAIKRMGYKLWTVSTVSEGSSYEDHPSLVERIRYRLRLPVDRVGANRTIRDIVAQHQIDLIWMDRAVEIRWSTLKCALRSNAKIKLIWYSEDDMMNPIHRSRYLDQCIPFFDLWVTTKSYNAKSHELPALGVKKVLFVNNSYDPDLHPLENTGEEKTDRFRCDVSFIGTYERPRATSLIYLANNGIEVRVWGNGWSKLKKKYEKLIVEDYPVYEGDYVQAIRSSKINLCFLRKSNRDLQTCRSIEIPAIGGFMLHERNDEICSLFEEDEEAIFFSNDHELLEKIEYWLNYETGRIQITRAGHKRVLNGEFTHEDRLMEIIGIVTEDKRNASFS